MMRKKVLVSLLISTWMAHEIRGFLKTDPKPRFLEDLS